MRETGLEKWLWYGRCWIPLALAYHRHLLTGLLGTVSRAISNHSQNGFSEKRCIVFSLLRLHRVRKSAERWICK
jgi:hypothetical protein